MAQTKLTLHEGIVERNIILSGKIMQFLMDHPQVLSVLPEKFELVILPDDDPEVRQHNLELLDKYGSEDKPIVFARIKAHQDDLKTEAQPSIFVPVHIAA
jgi:hypothetical protein